MPTIEVRVPPIGGFKDVPVIEVLVKPGDQVKAEASLVTLESDKATMDVPSPTSGTVRELRVKVGDRVSEGSLVLTLEAGDGARAGRNGAGAPARDPAPAPAAPATSPAAAPPAAPTSRAPAPAPPRAGPLEVRVPSLGAFKDVPVIEVLVKPGDQVKAEAPLVVVESEKATMEIPSPAAGRLRELRVKAGDRVSEGSLIAILEGVADVAAPAATAAPKPGGEAESRPPAQAPAAPQPALPAAAAPAAGPAPGGPVAHASPSIRRMARDLGVALGGVTGTGPHGRILREDVQRFVKESLARPAARSGPGLDLPPWPRVDFAKFGPVERQPLPRIRKLSAANLARNWVMIPHVTQHDEADITDLERFRGELNAEQGPGGAKVTLLAFVVKACVAALKRFPEVNASLDGDELVLKRYYHLGFAADTPAGLVVPVLRDADRKGLLDVARELAALAAKAREGKLSALDMQGGTFSISSLGGIGGTAFTPIVNAPEVAILGVSRSQTRPVWDGSAFQPRLMLPLSLSYDHRVVDGALAARFTAFLAQVLGDFRRAML